MRIGQLSARAGVSVRALRYYEEQGLLVPQRSLNGYRVYDDSAVDRVGQIQLLYSAGLCSAKIAELLPCVSGDRDRVVPGDGLIDSLRVEHDRISRQIAEMNESLRVLESVIDAGTAR